MTERDRLTLLREAVESHGSQSKVCRKLGYSTAAISQALSGSYKGSMNRLLARVEEVFGTRAVSCPVLGEIVLPRCVAERRTPFSTSNPLRVRLYRACMDCQFNTDLNND
ncbi:MAG: helix-turn-helix transcriptional regulator [Proteobacteria bacterium]|nr:helix-turn-helix transcriptional regulator [Pseudomonadota bacterium]MBU1058080.1 helix-turn-helix transcriptional regulator [Pseudomonadota bacterium]